MAIPCVIDEKEKTEFTVKGKKRVYLRTYAKTGIHQRAKDKADISANTHYQWLKDDPIYASEYVLAQGIAADTLEDAIMSRGRDGTQRQVGWYQGKPGGIETVHHDNLAMFRMKALRPDIYRETLQVTNDTRVHITVDDARTKLLAMMERNPQLASQLAHVMRPQLLEGGGDPQSVEADDNISLSNINSNDSLQISDLSPPNINSTISPEILVSPESQQDACHLDEMAKIIESDLAGQNDSGVTANGIEGTECGEGLIERDDDGDGTGRSGFDDDSIGSDSVVGDEESRVTPRHDELDSSICEGTVEATTRDQGDSQGAARSTVDGELMDDTMCNGLGEQCFGAGADLGLLKGLFGE